MKYLIKSKEIFLEDKIFDGNVLVEDGVITQIGEEIVIDGLTEIIELKNLKLLPGLIDIHVHGGNGFDIMNGTYEAVNEISKFKIEQGVTSFCPTTVTASDDKTDKAILAVKEAVQKKVDGAKILGTFLEGPFISPKNKGAHPEEYIKKIDLKEIGRLIELGDGTIKSIAIAPEIENGIDAIEFIVAKNINVRIGHSAAEYETVVDAIDKGANIAIHTYNAMSPLNHRKPGMVGAVLTDDRIYGELISDMVHVAKAPIEILTTCKKDKVVLITDCMEAGGLPDGDYMLGELGVTVKDSIAKVKGTDTIAGSTLNLMTGVKNMNTKVLTPMLEVVKMASLYPARALKLDDKIGSIKISKSADLVAIDDDFNVKFVMVDGKIMKYNL